MGAVSIQNPGSPENKSGAPRRLSRALLILPCVGIFLATFGAKLIIISHYTMPHPYWDSWQVEGLETYTTYLSGHYRAADLFAPASEHRPAILRLYGLALLALDGQWDVQLQMVGTAALFGVFGCLFFAFARGALPPLYSFLLASATALTMSLPIGWENTVNGHHAGWFFFYISTALTFWLCIGDERLSHWWWVGFTMAIIAYLSLFAGVITSFAAAAGMLFRYVLRRRYAQRTFAGIVALLVLFALGIAWENRFPGQANVKAKDFASFLKALSYALVWPNAEISVSGFVIYLPFLAAITLLLLRRLRASRSLLFVVTFVFWVLLQAAGMAYARGMNGIPPVPRYLDIMSFGLLANFVLLLMLAQSRFSGRISLVVGILAVAWVWYAGLNLQARMGETCSYSLPSKAKASFTQDALLRAYVATRDGRYLDNKSPADIAYYGGPDILAGIVNDPVVRPVLAYSIREPLAEAWPSANPSFHENGVPPGFPLLQDRDVLGSFDSKGVTGAIESDRIRKPKFPYLEIRVAGAFASGGVSLRIVSDSGERIEVRPPVDASHRWVSVLVPSPSAPFRIVATDSDPRAWLAFSPPREVGRASFWAARLLAYGAAIYGCGAAALVAMLGVALYAVFASRLSTTRDAYRTSVAVVE